MPLSKTQRTTIVHTARRHEKDSGSPEVQISLLTGKIEELAGHLKTHRKDHHSRRGLVLMVGKRNRLLRYLARTDRGAYQALIGRLGLRK